MISRHVACRFVLLALSIKLRRADDQAAVAEFINRRQLETLLSTVEEALAGDVRLRLKEVVEAANHFPIGDSKNSFNPFYLLAQMLHAHLSSADTSDLKPAPGFASAPPLYIVMKAKYMMAALVVASVGVQLDVDSQYFYAYRLEESFLNSIRSRWPRTNGLPSRILPSLGCPSGNVSFAKMLSLNMVGNPLLTCRGDLAVLSTKRWRHFRKTLRTGLEFDFLLAWFSMRPLLPGMGRDIMLLESVLKQHVTNVTGLFLEFGVYKGNSINTIARHLQQLGGGRVFGFDSFKGLPETWQGASSDSRCTDVSAGSFAVEVPSVESNVELRVGYFNETLPDFLQERVAEGGAATIQLLHLDADLYSSTWEVLRGLHHLIVPGTIVVLDDMVNFPGFRQSALRAFADFLNDADLAPAKVELLGAPIALNSGNEIERAIAIRVL